MIARILSDEGPSSGRGCFRRPRMKASAVAVAAVALLASAGSIRAQSQGNGYLFGEPSGSFTLRGGFARANAGSDIFTFATSQLTIGRDAFSGPTLGADLAVRLGPRLDLLFSAEYAGTSAGSEFRHFVDNNDQPIQQTTEFYRVPLTVGARYYLTDRGRAIGQYAWIPARIAPYVGAGAGVVYYSFRQHGDFVDFKTNDVFNEDVSSARWAPTVHALAGVDYSLTPRFALTTQGKYAWGSGNLNHGPGGFDGFDKIDLSGFAATVGLSVRF